MFIQFCCQKAFILCHPVESTMEKKSNDAKGKCWSWQENNGQDGEEEMVTLCPSFKVDCIVGELFVLWCQCRWKKRDEEAKKKQRNELAEGSFYGMMRSLNIVGNGSVPSVSYAVSYRIC
jgi:hypothetical protein